MDAAGAAPAPPQSAPPGQPAAFAPPVISRDGGKRSAGPAKPAKAPVVHERRGLRPYLILGLVITAVLSLVVVGLLWLFIPDDVDSVPEAETEGADAPRNVQIASWIDGEITLTWEAPTNADEAESQLQYYVLAQRVGDDQASNLGETVEHELSAGGLIPDEEYCFQVAALWEVSYTPMSEPVCTNDEDSEE
ncbi:hypothetical protein GCM10029992_60200 [Glycomyces albus]